MYKRMFRLTGAWVILWPALILALLYTLAQGEDVAPAGEPLPKTLVGIWQVTGVLADAGSHWVHSFGYNDPRLMGGILFVSPQRMLAKAGGEIVSCKNPTVTVQKMTAGQLLKKTVGGQEPPENPLTRVYGLPFDQNDQLTVMWIKGFGEWNDLSPDGTWMIEMPDGRLAMLWRNFAIILLSRAPANTNPVASFDCGKAQTPVEKTICGSMELALLDSDVSDWHKGRVDSLLNRARGHDKRYLDALKQYKNEQKAWLKQRDTCGADPECLKKSMDFRVDSLGKIEFPEFSNGAVLSMLYAPLQGDGAAPVGKPLPKSLIGTWQVTEVLADAGPRWVGDFGHDDPRLMGGVVLISPQRILAKTGNETMSCKNPTVILQDLTADRLIKETMGRRPKPPEYPTPRDYGFPLNPNDPLTIMWIKGFEGYWEALSAEGTWMLEMPDGRLAMRWRDSAILLLSRAPANIKPVASFDCGKAQSPVKKTICGSMELSLLDSYVSEWYAGQIDDFTYLAKVNIVEPESIIEEMKQLKREQKAWIKQRDTCGSEATCLKDSMDARADTLGAIDTKKYRRY